MDRFLIDTQVFIWKATGENRLSDEAVSILQSEHELLLSSASIWEMAIKVSIGKLRFHGKFSDVVEEEIILNQYKELVPAREHLYRVRELGFHHKDPFDRLIIA